MILISNKALILLRLIKIKWPRVGLILKDLIKYPNHRKVQHYKDLEEQIVKQNLNSIIRKVGTQLIVLYNLTLFRVLSTE